VGLFGLSANDSMAMWVWATQHPYLFTLIKVSTPTTIVLLMYAASRVLFGGTRKSR